MKKFEITIRPDGIKISREGEERMTAEQKFALLLSLIVVCFLITFIALLTSPFR